ncbi:hypothetical protein ACTI_07470 [Actinoplanes sp. OR16]|uniref:CU044_5270 family protein n=1 Tax=Actinoplanes sp. OR16 TaxID=946334 RepID=UPI000F6EF39D|nr:CU044_5270 family protein [Actinoplanes sp. OR16]BBH64062.1 hypothetical protein ACTI_07470 [Actinoplanes sp. OR16]
MLTRMAAEARALVKPLDPAAHTQPVVPEQARAEDLRRILASAGHGHARRAGSPRAARKLAWGSAAAAVVAGAVATAVTLTASPSLAYNATPAPLVITKTGDAGSAAEILTAIAARAEKSPATAGAYDHLVTESWSLWSRIDDEQVTSAVIPTRTESWRSGDDAGTTITTLGAPTFPSKAHREAWEDSGSPGEKTTPTTQSFAEGRFPAMWSDEPPTDLKALQNWLTIGHPTTNGPAETVVAITDLARENALTPATRANVLRILASLKGLTHEGTATDSQNREGEAFSLVSDHTGLPTHYTLLIDPTTGALLTYEQELRTTAGKLAVKLPAVISYELYLKAEETNQPG